MCVLKNVQCKVSGYASLRDRIIFLEHKNKNTFALASVA